MGLARRRIPHRGNNTAGLTYHLAPAVGGPSAAVCCGPTCIERETAYRDKNGHRQLFSLSDKPPLSETPSPPTGKGVALVFPENGRTSVFRKERWQRQGIRDNGEGKGRGLEGWLNPSACHSWPGACTHVVSFFLCAISSCKVARLMCFYCVCHRCALKICSLLLEGQAGGRGLLCEASCLRVLLADRACIRGYYRL